MAMVCSFVLAFAVMLWHRQSAASASQDLSRLPPAMPVAAPHVIRLAAAASQPLTPPLAAPPLPRPAAVNAQEDRREAPNDIPVELSFRRRPTGNDGEHYGRIAWHVTGRIHNLSDEALAVDVTVER
jgi:hypothetical protein